MTCRLIALWVVCLGGVGCASRPPLPPPMSCSLAHRTFAGAPVVLLARPEIVTTAPTRAGALEWGPDDDAALVGARFVGAIEEHYPELAACFDRGRDRDAALEGRVSVKLTIAPSGDVVSLADGGSTTLPHRGVIGCVQSTFTRMKFAPWDGEAITAVLPVDFAAPRELSCAGSRAPLAPLRGHGAPPPRERTEFREAKRRWDGAARLNHADSTRQERPNAARSPRKPDGTSDAITPVRVMVPRLVAAVSLALLVGASGGVARAEGTRTLALTFRPSLDPTSLARPTGRPLTLAFKDTSLLAFREGASQRPEDAMYAPLRGAWTGVSERCGARICETDATTPKTGLADEAVAQLGVVTVLLSAFMPKGEVFAIHSGVTGQKIRFTPMTFATTGAGVRVWGTF